MRRHALDEARASEGDPDAERAVLYEQVLAGLQAVDTDKPPRTLPEFHDWFTPTVPSEAAGEMPEPASEAGDVLR